jgi:hypothetical protein
MDSKSILPNYARVLNANCIARIDWPSCFPDLNPIENDRALLEARLRKRQDLSKCLNAGQIYQAAQAEWEMLDGLR